MTGSQLSFQFPEQDNSGDGNLPTYYELAAEAGPNSRFGRWQGWVEKRAAERYADVTPQEAAWRRARGWGQETSSERERGLRAQTGNDGCPPDYPIRLPPSLPPPFTGKILSPAHLMINQFGSRFLPHTTSPIHCILPVLADRFILIGHDDGLSVLNMFPKEWTESGIVDNGPCDASSRIIWQGEAVFQLSLLEVDDARSGGTVLALVGLSEESPKDSEPTRSLRMYHLSNLISLVKWSASNQYTGPLDLPSSSLGNSRAGPSKKVSKTPGNIAKGLKSLAIDSPISPHIEPFDALSASRNALHSAPSFTSMLVVDKKFVQSIPIQSIPIQPIPNQSISGDNSASSTDSSRDVIEDLPLRLATDYISLANTGSRLTNLTVLFFEIWSDEFLRGRKGVLLAVATKSSILLYETPKTERVFRFVKEFYVPSTPRSMSFVRQAVHNSMARSPSDVGTVHLNKSSSSRAHTSHQRSISTVAPTIRYSDQLTLFVVFEKKAGLIRITDSAVSEVELHDELQPSFGLHPPSSTRDNLLSPNVGLHSKRSNRASWDSFGFMKEKATWTLPTQVDLTSSIAHSSVYLLTRAKRTHIIPYPLPADLVGTPSFRVLTWSSTPKHVRARVCHTSRKNEDQPSFLQIIAFGEDGMEVQEVPLHFLSENKNSSSSSAMLPVQVMSDSLGGETSPLCVGGLWHRSRNSDLANHGSAAGNASPDSIDGLDTDELIVRLMSEQGIYGWVQKGSSDWRVFWVGGTATTTATADSVVKNI